MLKATIQYTTKDLRELGLFVEVAGRTDNDRTRKKALEEIKRRIDDSEGISLNEESFADELSADDLIVVESPLTDESEVNEPEVLQAARAIANLANLRVTLEEAYQQAVELHSLIEALFSPEPLTPEQIQQASDKNFAKTLIKFAEAKAAQDKFLPVAQEAWDILAPLLSMSATNSNHFADESKTKTILPVSETLQATAKNGQKVSNS